MKLNKLSAAARREENWGRFMVAPTIIGLFVLNIWPFLQTIYTSFCEHLGFGKYKFIGPQNYIDMFGNTEFWKATWNTVWFCVLTVPIGMVLALFVAMLLNTKVKFKGGFRTIFFLPLVCAPAAVAMVWQWIFNGEYGILNQILGTNIQWITNPKTAVLAVAIVSVWSSVGYDAVLLLAGLQNIPKTLYEANSIDGAGKIRQFFTITVPMISPSLFSVLIMRLMASMKVYDLIYMMSDETNPAMADMQSLMYLFYRSSFVTGDRGYGSAIVIWTVSLILLVTLIQFWGQKKWVTYDI